MDMVRLQWPFERIRRVLRSKWSRIYFYLMFLPFWTRMASLTFERHRLSLYTDTDGSVFHV